MEWWKADKTYPIFTKQTFSTWFLQICFAISKILQFFESLTLFHFLKIIKFALRRYLTNFVTPDLKLHNRYYHTEQTSLTSFHVCAFLIFFTYYIYAGSVVLVKETQFKKNIYIHITKIYIAFLYATLHLLNCSHGSLGRAYQLDKLGRSRTLCIFHNKIAN